MKQRIITGLILLAVICGVLFASSSVVPLEVFLLLTAYFAGEEWRQFIPSSRAKYLPFVLPLLVLASFSMSSFWPVLWLGVALLSIIAGRWVVQFPGKTPWFTPRNMTLIAIWTTVASACAMIYIYSTLSVWWLLFGCALVWLTDSGAYFTGRKFGKTPMAPLVSPAKTMEGLTGGVAVAVSAVLFFAWYKNLGLMSAAFLAVVSMFTVYAAVIGDLLESMYKRKVNVKDSGYILPGHGGVLDRIDSLLTALPVYAAGLYAMNTLYLIP